MSDLPDDILRDILLCLDHHQDLLNFSAVSFHFNHLAQDDEIWRALSHFQFSERMDESHLQIAKLEGWMAVYKMFVKRSVAQGRVKTSGMKLDLGVLMHLILPLQ